MNILKRFSFVLEGKFDEATKKLSQLEKISEESQVSQVH